MQTTIYHNPRCQTSRNVLAILKEKRLNVEIIEYLKTPPTEGELQRLLDLLGMKPETIVRKREALYREQYKNKNLTDSEWLEILANNPILIERPIVVSGTKAVLARPPERVNELWR